MVGIIAGWLAKRVIPGEAPRGVFGDLPVAVVGAIAGGLIFNFGPPGATGVNIGSIVVAFVGAVVVLWLTRQLTGTRHARWHSAGRQILASTLMLGLQSLWLRLSEIPAGGQAG